MEPPAQNCPSEITIIGEAPQESRYRATRNDILTQKKRASSSLSSIHNNQASKPIYDSTLVTRAPHQYLPGTKGASYTAQPTQQRTSRSEKGVVEPVKKL